MRRPLDGVRVTEIAQTQTPLALRIAMSFTARIAADLGASVCKCVPASGDPLRAIGPLIGGTSALSAFLDAGKSIVTSGGDTLADCDILLCDANDAAPCKASVRTAFAMSPDLAGNVATEFTIMASGGLLDLVGEAEREPLRLGGHQLAFSAGLAAYSGALAALMRSERTGRNEIVNVDLSNVAVWLNWKSAAMASWTARVATRSGRDAEWQIIRCADGFAALVYLEADWPVLRDFVDDPRLRDPKLDDRWERRRNARFVTDVVQETFLRYTRRELRDIALARRIPLGPVWTPVELESDQQLVAREFLARVAAPDGTSLLMPRLPVLWNNAAFRTPDNAAQERRAS